MPVYKKISELSKAETVTSKDAFLMDTSEGTGKASLDILRDSAVYSNAASHNTIFRGKNLTNIYDIEEICSRIKDGTFEDLYIGDYFDVTISTEFTASEVVRCVIAGFNTYMRNGDTGFNEPHAVIVPKNDFAQTHPMNDTHSTVGGYVNSKLHTEVLPIYYEALQIPLKNHIKTYRNLLSNSISSTGKSKAGAGQTGYSNSWAWYDCELCLLSEIQVYGANVWSSSFYDTGIQNLQLPLFELDPSAKVAGGVGGTSDGRAGYWLKNVASASYFAGVRDPGHSDGYGAAYSRGVRPHFLIG